MFPKHALICHLLWLILLHPAAGPEGWQEQGPQLLVGFFPFAGLKVATCGGKWWSKGKTSKSSDPIVERQMSSQFDSWTPSDNHIYGSGSKGQNHQSTFYELLVISVGEGSLPSVACVQSWQLLRQRMEQGWPPWRGV